MIEAKATFLDFSGGNKIVQIFFLRVVDKSVHLQYYSGVRLKSHAGTWVLLK